MAANIIFCLFLVCVSENVCLVVYKKTRTKNRHKKFWHHTLYFI